MLDADELAYLDHLYEKMGVQATDTADVIHDRLEAREKFCDIVINMWPEISRTFDAHKHSL